MLYTFEPGSARKARATMKNPSSVALSYTGELYLGKYEGNKVATVSKTFSLGAGEQKAVDFLLTMPPTQDTYHVYLDVYHDGNLLAKYQATEDVTVRAEPKIEIIGITWT
jgi:hypothetical protein